MKKRSRTWLRTLSAQVPMRPVTLLLACVLALSVAAPAPTSAATQLAEEESPQTPTNVGTTAGSPEQTGAEASAEAKTRRTDEAAAERRSGQGLKREAMVVFGQNVELKAGETAEVVVVIGGSATIHGKVRDSVVAIGGNVEVDGEVKSEVVSVMGSISVRPPGVIGGDAVTVGGKLNVEEGATVKGTAQEVAVPGMRLPRVDWIQQFLAHCVLMARPLAPQVGWLWGLAFIFLLLYLFVAAVFRHPVQVSLNELSERPATTFVIGLLTILLVPLLLFILLVIVVGIPLIPFVLAAVVLLGILGKVAVLEWMGMKVGGLFSKNQVLHPVLALVVGSILLLILYMIPVVGFLTLLLLGVWSMGCAMTAASRGFRRELPEKRAAGPAPVPMPAMAYTAAYTAPGEPAGQGTPGAASVGFQPPSSGATEPPIMSDVLVYPKATFWERMAAAFLDVVLVVILGSIVGSPTAGLVIALAYVTGMWTWRGTTIGGVVLGLKVVRMNGEPLSFAVSLVRGLAAGFSAFVLFLGFFWIAWDRDRQGWHDRIAGTVVLRLPRGTPLVCL